MSFQTTLLDALCTHLDTVTDLAYRPTGTYTATEWGLYIDQLPTTPDRAVAVALYPVDDNTGTTDSTIGAQFRIRGRPGNRADVKNTADALYDALHDATGYHLGPVPIVRSWLQSAATLPPDGNNRQETTQNYYLQITRTAPHRWD